MTKKKKEEMEQGPEIRHPVGEHFQQQLRRTEKLLTEKVLFMDVKVIQLVSKAKGLI